MPVARYWRLAGFTPKGDLVLPSISLYRLGAPVDSSAVVTSTIAPVSGSLPGPVTFAESDVRAPGFAIEWDLVTPAYVDKVAVPSDAFLSVILQYRVTPSDPWVTETPIEALTTGGPPFLPDYAADNLSPIYFMVANNANPFFTPFSWEVTSLTSEARMLRFPYGVRVSAEGGVVVPAVPVFTAPLSPRYTLYFEVSCTQTSAQYAGATLEFLNQNDDVVAVVRSTTVGGLRTLETGPNLASLTTFGTYSRGVAVNISFTSTDVVLTPTTTSSGWLPTTVSFAAPATSITQVRVTTTDSFNNWSGSNLALSRLYAVPAVGESARLGITRGDSACGHADLNGGSGRIVASVKEFATPINTALYRRVQLIADRSGEVVAETWSNPDTGVYEFKGLDHRARYTAVAFDHTGVYKAVVADNLAPERLT